MFYLITNNLINFFNLQSWPFTFQQQHDMRQTSTTPSSSSDHWSPPRDSPEPMIHHYRANHSIYGAIVHGQ